MSVGWGLLVHIATGPLLQVASRIYKSRIGRRVGALVRLAGVAGGHHGTCGACVLLQSHMRNIRSIALERRRTEGVRDKAVQGSWPQAAPPNSHPLVPSPGRSANRRKSWESSDGQMTVPTSPDSARGKKETNSNSGNCFPPSRFSYLLLCKSLRVSPQSRDPPKPLSLTALPTAPLTIFAWSCWRRRCPWGTAGCCCRYTEVL